MFVRDSCHDRSDDNVKVDTSIGNDYTNVSPFVRKQFGQRKRCNLTVASTEAEYCVSGNGLLDRLRCSAKNRPDQHEDVSKQDERAASKQVTVRTANHEGDGTTQAVDGSDPSSLDSLGAKIDSYLRLDCAEEWHRPERDTIRGRKNL